MRLAPGWPRSALGAPAAMALLAACTFVTAAQEVPARDLLRFPLGTMDRATALASSVGDGLGNPAAVSLEDSERVRAGAAALQTATQQGVAGQLFAAAVRIRGQITVGV